MKRYLLSAAILLSACTLSLNAQNEDAFEKFRKERSGEMDKFAAEREAEYKKFKAQYEKAFEQFKQLYISFLKEEESVVDLMASDDGIKLQPAAIEHKPVIAATAVDLKSKIKQSLTNVKKLTPEQLLPTLSTAKDTVEQMQEAAQNLETIVRDFNEETSTVESISVVEQPKVILEPVQQTVAATGEVTAAALDEEFLARLRAEEQQDAGNKCADSHSYGETDASQSGNTESSCTDRGCSAESQPGEQCTGDQCIPHGKPTQYVRISSPFGTRVHPITHKKHTHKGVDMAAPKMTPVYAAADGTVTFAKYNGGYGNFVKVNHGNGYKTAYAHLHKIAVKNGKKIRKGELIGYVGTTGRSTGNHLHYEVYYKESLIDPATTL